MIVDTSALVACILEEEGHIKILNALQTEVGFIPTPVIVELHRVTKLSGNQLNTNTLSLITTLLDRRITILPFDVASAEIASSANALYGSGNGKGGKLNMLDLMVYGAAKAMKLPILCTGRDFAATDALLHQASRLT